MKSLSLTEKGIQEKAVEQGFTTALDCAAFASSYLKEAIGLMERIPIEQVVAFLTDLQTCRRNGGHVFCCGNGGSASAASHFVADLARVASASQGGKFEAYSLVDNLAWTTALANDQQFEAVFVEQLRNLASPGDLLIAFSTSGRSSNVLRAVEWANQEGLITWALTGGENSPLVQAAKNRCVVPGSHTGHLEEAHLLIHHIASYFFARTT